MSSDFQLVSSYNFLEGLMAVFSLCELTILIETDSMYVTVLRLFVH